MKVLWIFFFFTRLSVQEYLEEKIIARDLIEEFDREDSLVFEPQFVHNICEIILEKGEKRKRKSLLTLYIFHLFFPVVLFETLYTTTKLTLIILIFSRHEDIEYFFFFLLNFENTRKY